MGVPARERVQIPGMWPYDVDITGAGESTSRVRAISVILAAEASTFDNVRRFRADHLGGAVLPADGIRAWIKALPENQEVKEALWLCDLPMDQLNAVSDGSYIIPAALMRRMANAVLGDRDVPRLTTRQLHYAAPDIAREWEIIRTASGVLNRLHSLALDLVDFHRAENWRERASLWKEEQATTFVLTGYAPLVPPDAFPLPARSGRRQTDKHLQLAAFTAWHEAEDKPLAARMAEWNTRYPHWAYKNTTNFGWDSRQAERRLMSIEGAEPEPEATHTAEEIAAAHGEQVRQQSGKPNAVWGADVPHLARDVRARAEREKAPPA